MYYVEANTINQALSSVCKKFRGLEPSGIAPRGMRTIELHPFMLKLNNPIARTLLFPARGNNPSAILYETVWVLGAFSNNISTLRKFIPRADEYSDNPNSPLSRWRAGYPERIRNWNGLDQLEYVYKTLKADKDSRQAVVSFWNPESDCFEGNELLQSRDKACTSVLMFKIRDNKLHLTVCMRSNDAIFGMFSINIYEFTAIQEIMACMLGVEVGEYYHMSDSLHIYEKHYEKVEALAKIEISDIEKDLSLIPKFEFAFSIGADPFSYTTKMYRVLEHRISNINTKFDEPFVVQDNIRDMFIACKGYLDYLDDNNHARYFDRLSQMQYTDLKVSCIWWLLKKLNKEDKGFDGIFKAIRMAK